MARIFFFLVLISFSIFANSEVQKVSLQLKWKYQFQFAGFIIAQEKGFYKDLGLDVELKELSGEIDIVGDVLKGKSTFGMSDSALIYDRLKNKDIKALMAVFQESPFILMGLKRDDLTKLEDLNNKTIAIHEGVDGISIQAMLKVKDISYKVHPPVFNFNKLLAKQIDLKTAYISNEPFIAKGKDMNIVTFSPKDYGFEGYGDILFSSSKTIEENPQMVQKFYKASKKGWKYAFDNINETVNIIYNKYNSLKKSKEALLFEAYTLKKLSGIDKNFGELDFDKIKGIAQQFNLVKNEHNSLENLNDFIYEKPKQKIKVCYSNDLKPYQFTEDSKPKGLAIDVLNMIEKNSDMKFEYLEAGGYREDLKFLKNKKCDISPTIVSNISRHDFINTTIPYSKEYLAFITKIDYPYIDDLNNLKNKKIAFNRTYGNAKFLLKKLYPNLQLILLEQQDALEKLEKGEIDVYIDGFITLSYFVKEKYKGVLKLNNAILGKGFNLSIAVHKDKKELLNSLNNTLKEIPSQRFDELSNRWRYLDVKKEIDYKLLSQVIAITLILLIVMIVVNIRERKLKKKIQEFNNTLEQKVQEEIEKNREKEKMMLHQSRLAQMGEMISMIAHQWRQPLNNLSVLNQTVILKYRMGKLNKDIMDEFKENSKTQILQMSRTIDDFSNFFKPDKEKVDFFVDDAINDVINILNPIFEKNKIHVDLKLEKKVLLNSYKNEFGQALLNILTNAKDAFIDNTIVNKKIDITLEKTSEGINLLIIDNAGGIDAKIVDKIFDPYFSTKGEKNGTGLGLYMTKLIIEDHMNGKISLESLGENSKFFIVFK